jgi:hypothetical protein
MKMPKQERGQSLVELAISLVVLLYLLSGAVEFGLAFFQFVQLRDAAQEGALYGSMNPTNCTNITSRIQNASSSPVDLAGPDVTIAISINGNPCGSAAYSNMDCEGNGLLVEVSYPHEIFMPFIPKLIGRDTIDLNAEVTDTILSPVNCT